MSFIRIHQFLLNRHCFSRKIQKRTDRFYNDLLCISSAKLFSVGRQLGIATFEGIGLSFSIESLQMLLRVGLFEVTDLVMNLVGGGVGVLISAGERKVVGREVIDFNP